MFEHNKIGVWKTVSLKSVIEELLKHGFLCYYMGRPTLTRLTQCWVRTTQCQPLLCLLI